MDDRKLVELARRALRDRDRSPESAARLGSRIGEAMGDRRLEELFAREPKEAARPVVGGSRWRTAAGIALPILASAMLACGAIIDRGPQLEAWRLARLWPSEYDAAVMDYAQAASAAFDLRYGGK
jgi:hypothetical protein